MTIMNPYNYKKPVGERVEKVPNVQPQNVGVAAYANKYKSDSYLEQKIMNARPEELTLMLYDGIIKFIKQTMLYNDQRAFDKSNTSNQKAQAILQELRSTLNMDVPLSENLESLYLFMMERLVEANIKKNNDILNEVLDLATDLRDTWKTAMNL